MKCIYCETQFDFEESLAASPFSWPEMSAFWYECPACGKGNHINVREGGYALIRILGAPGPDWEQLAFFPCASIRVRQDPGFLHVWLGEKHYEVPARP